MSLQEPHTCMAEKDTSSDDVVGNVGGEGEGALGSGVEGDDVLGSMGEGGDVLGSGAEGDSLLGSGVGGDDVLGSDGGYERDHVAVGVWEDDAELDYEEEMIEEAGKQTDVCEEDEVKVHATGNIEEGEVSSGEEGEIKDESDEPHSPSHHQPPSPQQPGLEATPTGRHGNVTEPDQSPQQGEKEVSGETRDRQTEERPPKNMMKLSDASASGIRETKIGAICRHYLQGKCSWGKECRFLHGSPDDQDLLAAKPVTEKLPPHERRMGSLAAHMTFPRPPFLPPHGPAYMRGPPERYMVPAAPFMAPPGPEFMRPPPRGPVREFPGHLGPPVEGEFERPSFFLPHEPHNGPKGISEVAEESDGWYRLRTVASQWSSDERAEGDEEEEEEEQEEEGEGGKVRDLRHKLKQKAREEEGSESGGDVRDSGLPQQWTDPWLRGRNKTSWKEQTKKRRRREETETYHSSTEEEEEKEKDEEEEVIEKKAKKRHKPHSLEGKRKVKRYKHAREVSSEESSEEERPREKKKKTGKKKKKRHHSSSSSSLEDDLQAHHHQYPYHLPPFLPPHHHLPPPPPLPPPGLPGDRERWPLPPPHRHHPMDPYGPPMSHHGRYSDRFGPPFRVYEEWRGFHRSPPPPHLSRDIPPHLPPLSPPPEREWQRHHSHRSREGRHHHRSGRSPGSVPIPNQSSESSSDSSPERGRKRPQVKERKVTSRKSDAYKLSDKALSRKEKLLHELSAINKVIERKKLKKHT